MTTKTKWAINPLMIGRPAILEREWVLDLLQVCHSKEGRYKYDFIAFSSLGFSLRKDESFWLSLSL